MARYTILYRMWLRRMQKGDACVMELCFRYPGPFSGYCSTCRHREVERVRFPSK